MDRMYEWYSNIIDFEFKNLWIYEKKLEFRNKRFLRMTHANNDTSIALDQKWTIYVDMLHVSILKNVSLKHRKSGNI